MNDAIPRPQAKTRKALTPLLEIRNLTKSYDGQHAVDDVSLTIYKGEIYTALIRIDYSLVEAALDLGARPLKTFFTVIVPLTKGGIIAGSMLVFIPAVGEFVIPELLGGPDSIMIGRVLWQEFFNNRDWPVASAVAIVMLLLLIMPIMWFHKHQQKSEGEHG